MSLSHVSHRESKKSQRLTRLWVFILLAGLAIMVTVLGVYVWVSQQFQPLTSAELRAEAEMLDLVILDQDAKETKRKAETTQPEWPCATWAELDDMAADGEPVLFTVKGQPFTWLGITGVSFSDSLSAAREMDASITEERAAHLLSQTGVSYVPGMGGPYPHAETLGARYLSSCINAMIKRGWQYHAGLQFVTEHKIKLDDRVDFAAAWEADNQYRTNMREYFAAVREGRRNLKQSAEIRIRSKELTRRITIEQWENVLNGDSLGEEAMALGDLLAAVVPRDWPQELPVALWHRWDWEIRFHQICILDYIDAHPEVFGPLTEERHGDRDWVSFSYFRPSDKSQVEKILKAITRRDGTIDHTLARQQMQLSSGIADTIFLSTNKDLRLKEVYSDMRPMHELIPGKLTFRLPTASQPHYFGFEFLGRKIVRSRYSNHRGYTNTWVKGMGQESIAREYLARIQPDFQPHARFPITSSHVGASLCGGIHFHNLWEGDDFPRPFIKSTDREREILEDTWKQVSSGKPSTLTDWPEIARNWNANRYRTAVSMLDRSVRNSSWARDEKNHWTTLVGNAQGLPSVVAAPK